MSEHTPGPWEIETDDNPRRVRGIFGPWTDGDTHDGEDLEVEWNTTCMTVVRWRKRIVQTDSGYYPPRIDDARLIAAAPDMLDALNAMRDGAYGNPSYPAENDAIDAAADAAIAKAEGR